MSDNDLVLWRQMGRAVATYWGKRCGDVDEFVRTADTNEETLAVLCALYDLMESSFYGGRFRRRSINYQLEDLGRHLKESNLLARRLLGEPCVADLDTSSLKPNERKALHKLRDLPLDELGEESFHYPTRPYGCGDKTIAGLLAWMKTRNFKSQVKKINEAANAQRSA